MHVSEHVAVVLHELVVRHDLCEVHLHELHRVVQIETLQRGRETN
jgi:hypothetical protein